MGLQCFGQALHDRRRPIDAPRSSALPIWFTPPHLHLLNGSQPNPLDLQYEKGCRTKGTSVRRRDSVGSVILKPNQ